jgi:hypothetical protein
MTFPYILSPFDAPGQKTVPKVLYAGPAHASVKPVGRRDSKPTVAVEVTAPAGLSGIGAKGVLAGSDSG